MNIFILSEDPIEAAQLQCDKHVVKMVLETTQILCTVLHQYDEPAPYRPTHVNHPCVTWAATCIENFNWLHLHGLALCDEYTLRYGKRHKCQDILESIQHPEGMSNISRTPFVKAMPPYLQSIEDPVQAYRTYYQQHKANIATYKAPRVIPDFMVDYVQGNQAVDSGS